MKRQRILLPAILLLITLLISACHNNKMREYYSDESNYIIATGVVTHFSNNEELRALYIDFANLTPVFDDTCFKIVGENYDVVTSQGIMDSLQIGDEVQFCTAPKYFGDGYVMPIVSFSIEGKVLLEYEDGLANFLKWLV